MAIYYTLQTREPVIISRSTATTQHQSLDYIPGSALLGALATNLYRQLSDEQAFMLFHSGECRFSPAYPVLADHEGTQGEVALPVPASWHRIKGEETCLSNHTASDFIRNDLKQYQQLRHGFIGSSAGLTYAEVRTGLTARTALDSQTGRAKDGQLYQYAYIEAGQTFAGWIDCPDAALEALIRQHWQGDILLGRARSSEFGKASISLYQEKAEADVVNQFGHTLVLWCLSDVACLDQFGQPTLTPTAADLHPELQGQLLPGSSFIRSRRVRRFNRARGGLDSEQLLIAAGSVLTFTLTQPASANVLQQLAQQGCGYAKQQGLGWVMVNPAWAQQAEPGSRELFTPLRVPLPVVPQHPEQGAAADTPLLCWVKRRLDCDARQQQTKHICMELHHQIADAYQQARHYHRIPKQYQVGPGNSQWRRLAELVRMNNNSDWQKQAFDPESGICKTSNDAMGWGVDWQQNDQHVTLAGQLQQWLAPLSGDDLRLLLESLCRFDLSTSEGLKAYQEAYAPMTEDNK